ncbi:hypothetical protein [Pseudonocardia sp. KRD291]|uniref:hypothetical protein n=1 Tax=Pseudonocardia sp. KRD291 TaxID=2792007 RepID=UPI001C4A15B8|nr:hypothetical protein [Pseudonocardia sp. KRD291]MBW0104049.1 hypothetical protein [Pseudonocardia sp. KRD291]
MNRYWHVADGSVRAPSGGTHRRSASSPPAVPHTLSVDERFEVILVLERLRDGTPSRLVHDAVDRAIASMEEPGRAGFSHVDRR